MDRTILINRLDSQDNSHRKRRVFFNIGDMNAPEVSNRLIDLLHECNIVDSNDIVLKYNGIELNIATQNIPEIIKILCREDFSIYEVYQPYSPE